MSKESVITESDKVIISSGFSILRKKKDAELNAAYIFLCLTIPEIGIYQANKRTVIASTIPHLRTAHVLKIKIPILSENDRIELEELVKSSFDKKAERKTLLGKVKYELEEEFEVQV